ncbi:uncharacterized protein J3R85_006972 [Psidium guajava]|nr:uncharacterized protein J3R85_006972 [Psidium guajava]
MTPPRCLPSPPVLRHHLRLQDHRDPRGLPRVLVLQLLPQPDQAGQHDHQLRDHHHSRPWQRYHVRPCRQHPLSVINNELAIYVVLN